MSLFVSDSSNSSSASSYVSVAGVSKAYKTGAVTAPVLNDVSINIAKGTFALVIGKSGSGKSTLLNIIAGLDLPDRGSVKIDGVPLCSKSPDKLAEFRLRRIGLVFQFFNFLPALTIEENISLPAYLAGTKEEVVRKKCRELLGALAISDIGHKYPHEVSGGELQRSAVGRSLINDPAVVLADEPTGNLDDENSSAVFELLHGLTKERGMTLIMASHELEFVRRADVTLELRHGAVHAVG